MMIRIAPTAQADARANSSAVSRSWLLSGGFIRDYRARILLSCAKALLAKVSVKSDQ
jgi:hypothetical protein